MGGRRWRRGAPWLGHLNLARFSLLSIYYLLFLSYVQITNAAQMASVPWKMPKDLGSIPRSQPLFIIFFHRQSSALQIKRFIIYHQDLAIQFINAPDQHTTIGGPPCAPVKRAHWIRQSQKGQDLLGSKYQTTHPSKLLIQAHISFFSFSCFFSF